MRILSENTYDNISGSNKLYINVGAEMHNVNSNTGAKWTSVFLTKFFSSRNSDFTYRYSSGPITMGTISFGTKVKRDNHGILCSVEYEKKETNKIKRKKTTSIRWDNCFGLAFKSCNMIIATITIPPTKTKSKNNFMNLSPTNAQLYLSN